jgi:hypothetical protein
LVQLQLHGRPERRRVLPHGHSPLVSRLRLTNPVRPARRYSPAAARARRSWCVPPGPLDSAIPQQVRPFVRHPQLDSPALVPSKSVIAMASAALHRAAPSALVSRPIFGPTATASDNRAGHAGMAPRSPGSATSLLRHWPRAIADTSERAASAGIRPSHRSLVEPQFLDLPRIRRYTANSGEDFLLNSSGHGARPTSFAATFLLPNLVLSRSEPSITLSCTASRQATSRPQRSDLGHHRRRSHRGDQPVLEQSILLSRAQSKRFALGHFCQTKVGQFRKALKG